MKLEKDLLEALIKLIRFFEEKNIRFVLIGALVPALLIDLKNSENKIYGSRETKDIDCSINIDNWEEYDIIIQDLFKIGFKRRESVPEHKFFYGDIAFDIIPFGSNIVQNDLLVWPQSGKQMNLSGFDAMFQFARSKKITKDISVPIIPLPLSVFSKILAYLDREDNRDLEDIFYILEHYEEVEVSERRFDIVGIEGISYDNSGAFLIGQDLKKYVSISSLKHVHTFLNSFDDIYEPIVQRTSRLTNKDPDMVLELISAFKQGLGFTS